MNRTMGFAIAATVLVTSVATEAFAQNENETLGERGYGYLRQRVRAPSNALEIGVDTGYAQGFGSFSANNPIGNVAGPGAAFGLSLGYRATPLLYVGWTGRMQEYSRRSGLPAGSTVYGVATSVNVDFHIKPYDRLDPWVGVGAGYRGIARSPVGVIAAGYTQGFELIKLQAGVDLRATESVAVGPVIGADVDYFLWNRPIGTATTGELSDRRLSTFVYVGVKGRFDLAGIRKSAPAHFESAIGRQ